MKYIVGSNNSALLRTVETIHVYKVNGTYMIDLQEGTSVPN